MDDDALPPEVQAQVDAALKGGNEDDEPKTELAQVPEGPAKPLSRRQQAEQERIAQIEAANKRAEAAEKIADELRKSREQDRVDYSERFARMEQAITFATQQRQQEPQRQADPGPSMEDQLDKARERRDKALSDGDVGAYNKANEEIGRLHAKAERQAEAKERAQQMAQFQPQGQQFQKPPWMTAVEAQYPDVMMHPKGINTVTAFLQMDGGGSPELLDSAFKNAKERLGLGKKRDENNERQRAVLAGGPTSSTPRTSGNGKAGKSVNMPAGWKDAARKAGMSNDEYIRAHVAMHPEAVTRD